MTPVEEFRSPPLRRLGHDGQEKKFRGDALWVVSASLRIERYLVPYGICGIPPEPGTVINSEDYNNPSEVRSQAIKRLEDILAKRGKTDVPAPFWAFCQVADVKRLEELAEQPQAYITLLETGAGRALQACMCIGYFEQHALLTVCRATEELGQRHIVFFDEAAK